MNITAEDLVGLAKLLDVKHVWVVNPSLREVQLTVEFLDSSSAYVLIRPTRKLANTFVSNMPLIGIDNGVGKIYLDELTTPVAAIKLLQNHFRVGLKQRYLDAIDFVKRLKVAAPKAKFRFKRSYLAFGQDQLMGLMLLGLCRFVNGELEF